MQIMVDGYESVMDQPAWMKMRNMHIHPHDTTLPNGMVMTGNVFRRNIIYYHDPDAKLHQLRNVPFDHNKWESNLYWHQGLSLRIPIKDTPEEDEWAVWRKLGQDHYSIVADPLFIDPEKEDYRLNTNSPAFNIGFKPIPVDKIGPYEDDLRASWPIVEAEGAKEKPLMSDPGNH